MIRINERIARVLLYLLDKDYSISLSKVSEDTNININTLRKDLPRIKEILSLENLILVSKPNIGIKIEGNKETKENLKITINSIKKTLNSKESKIWLIAYLLFQMKLYEQLKTYFDFVNIPEAKKIIGCHKFSFC